jgi:hypothetical protein
MTTTFEDAQDIAFRFAQAAYLRKLKRLVGEADVAKLAGTSSRHSALMVVDDNAFTIQVTIVCGKPSKVGSLEDLIKQSNRVTTTTTTTTPDT